MLPLARLRAFLAGEEVDQVPFMPIFMRYCAHRAGVAYREFIWDPEAHCRANLELAREFDSVWVSVMSDPYCEFEAYGGVVEYPADDLPRNPVRLLEDPERADALPHPDFSGCPRTRSRLEQLRRFRELAPGEFLITGWVEGPIAEYCDWRGMGDAFLDLYDCPATVRRTLARITDGAIEFARLQIEAGADCIGVGDAAASQLGPELYREFVHPEECRLIAAIRKLGVPAKLHICGDVTPILPELAATGAEILDLDYQVRPSAPQLELLKPGQVFCGNLDPVSLVRDGTPEAVFAAASALLSEAPGKWILSAGCEITPDTPAANLRALAAACIGS